VLAGGCGGVGRCVGPHLGGVVVDELQNVPKKGDPSMTVGCHCFLKIYQKHSFYHSLSNNTCRAYLPIVPGYCTTRFFNRLKGLSSEIDAILFLHHSMGLP